MRRALLAALPIPPTTFSKTAQTSKLQVALRQQNEHDIATPKKHNGTLDSLTWPTRAQLTGSQQQGSMMN